MNRFLIVTGVAHYTDVIDKHMIFCAQRYIKSLKYRAAVNTYSILGVASLMFVPIICFNINIRLASLYMFVTSRTVSQGRYIVRGKASRYLAKAQDNNTNQRKDPLFHRFLPPYSLSFCLEIGNFLLRRYDRIISHPVE